MSNSAMAVKSHNQNKFNRVSNVIGTLLLIVGFILATALPAAASEEIEYDDVYFNDYKLGFIEQMALEDHIDRDIPDGKYWFELETGMWGPIGGTANGRIVIPEDYQEYVRVRLFKNKPATDVTLIASTELITANDDLGHVKPIHPKPGPVTQVEHYASNAGMDDVKPIHPKNSPVTRVKLSASANKCDNTCLREFIYRMVAALSPPINL